MSNLLQLTVNGRRVQVPAGSVVAVAVALADVGVYRHSVKGEPRAMLCGMGICFECRVTINGKAHCLSCQTVCEEDMEVFTT
jgi:D-hydroxyproline dehydrogenase subunit gamma